MILTIDPQHFLEMSETGLVSSRSYGVQLIVPRAQILHESCFAFSRFQCESIIPLNIKLMIAMFSSY